MINPMYNESFCNLIEQVQCNAALAITGIIKETSQLKIYYELGIESLKFRRSGDNAEKIWAHQFFMKQKSIKKILEK